jgi:hypothetical protein
MVAVRITLGAPRFKLRYPIAASLRELAPDRSWFHAPAQEFRAAYLAKLEAAGYDAILSRLRELHDTAGRPVILLCYEDLRKPDLECHRTQLTRWLRSKGFPPVPELVE